MKEFWENEWDLFLNDMKELGEFFMQPVEITGIPGKGNKMLKPTLEEVKAKADNGGFWAREWKMFLNDMSNFGDFLLQPVDVTVKNEFWKNEIELFKEDLRNAKEFLTQPVEFK